MTVLDCCRLSPRLLLFVCLLIAGLPPLPLAAEDDAPLFLPFVRSLHQVIALDLDVSQPALSPDNQTVIFAGADDTGGMDLYTLNLGTRAMIRLTDSPDVVEETPLISADNRFFVYAGRDGQSWNLYARNFSDGEPYLLVEDGGADEIHPSLTADDARLFFAANREGGNWDIYSADLTGNLPAAPVRLTTDPAIERFPVVAQDGVVVFRREETGESDIQSNLYAVNRDGGSQKALTGGANYFTYPSAAPAHAGIVYVNSPDRSGYGQLMAANLGGDGHIPLPAAGPDAASPRLAADGNRLVYTVNAGNRRALVVQLFDDPLLGVGRAGYERLNEECSWENGVMATGWVQAWRATGDARYIAWVRTWVDGCLARGAMIQHANDAPLAFAALALHAETPDPHYWAIAEQAADYIFEQAQRAPDGTLIHLDDMVWDDTLMGITPFLVEMYAATGEARYLDEAASQALKHSEHLQDAATGLYYHAWRPATAAHEGAFWGRGNGWVLQAVADLLAALPQTHPQYTAVLAAFTRHADGLLAHQDGSGRWRTVINRPDAYLETSASALIVAGLAKAMNSGAEAGIPNPQLYANGVALGLRGVWAQVNDEGIVGGVSAPTWPMPEDEYLQQPISSFERYGQGVVLLMGAALAQNY